MRILYISKYAATPSSGRPTRQYFFSKHLAQSGNHVMLIYSNSNGLKNNHCGDKEQEIDGLLLIHKLNGPIINLGLNLKRIWSWIVFEYRLFGLFHQIKNFGPDIIIISSLSILTFVYGVHLKRRLNRPLVLEIRDLYPLTYQELNAKSNIHPFVKVLSLIEKYGYKNANLIISSLENIRSYVEQIRGNSINFKWIPMGVDLNLYTSSADISIEDIICKIRKLRSNGNFVIAYAGSIGKANSLEVLLRLSLDSDLRKKGIYFIFIGNGSLLENYKKTYLSGNAIFYDFVSKKYLPLVLKECNLLIHSWLDKKLYQYGISPNKWIEYMYAARPILLAFNGVSSIFQAAECGWQVPSDQYKMLKNEILKIYALPESVLDQKGKNGYDYLISNLDYSKLTIELEESLKECIKDF